MNTPLIDIGLNLANSAFKKDWEQVIQRAQAAGVTRFILTGTSVDLARDCARLAKALGTGVGYFTAGVHPHVARTLDAKGVAVLRGLLADERAVAVGETGLDFFRDLSPREVQRDSLRRHIDLACEFQKPLFLHERHASDDLLAILDSYSGDLPPCVVHCFTGGPEIVAEYVKRGYFLGITGWIGQPKRNAELLRAIPLIPEDRILLETDAPYLKPDQYRPPVPGRNEPAAMPVVASLVAAARGVSAEVLSAAVYRNTCTFFRLD